jgi:competence protein ComEC
VLFNLGFQLSFGALAGIFMFYQPMADLYTGKSWLLRNGWQAASITIAAQIGATPISLLYFGQFPTFFLLANVLASALGAVSLYSCFTLWLGSALPFVGGAIGKVLGWGIFTQMWLLNGLMHWIETLPFALLEHIHTSTFVCFLLLLLPTAIYEWLAWRRLESLWAACGLAALLGIWHSWHTMQLVLGQL